MTNHVVTYRCQYCGREWAAETRTTSGTGWTGFLSSIVIGHRMRCKLLSIDERKAARLAAMKRYQKRPPQHTTTTFPPVPEVQP